MLSHWMMNESHDHDFVRNVLRRPTREGCRHEAAQKMLRSILQQRRLPKFLPFRFLFSFLFQTLIPTLHVGLAPKHWIFLSLNSLIRLIDSALIMLICGNYAAIDNGWDGPSFLFGRVDLSFRSFSLMSKAVTHYGKAATTLFHPYFPQKNS
ncbi:hypothetical protein V8G54_014088 [Vigna mungo]|uniref:Uncharacterized protein n=1 Tax=Vigna mungo TaxID=3915 RepID=A0AAQ3RYA3_VIGMU